MSAFDLEVDWIAVRKHQYRIYITKIKSFYGFVLSEDLQSILTRGWTADQVFGIGANLYAVAATKYVAFPSNGKEVTEDECKRRIDGVRKNAIKARYYYGLVIEAQRKDAAQR